MKKRKPAVKKNSFNVVHYESIFTVYKFTGKIDKILKELCDNCGYGIRTYDSCLSIIIYRKMNNSDVIKIEKDDYYMFSPSGGICSVDEDQYVKVKVL